MNPLINIGKFIAYSVAGVAIRKTWNWFTKDVDPIPGTDEFDQEMRQAKAKYERLRKRKEEYEAYRKGR